MNEYPNTSRTLLSEQGYLQLKDILGVDSQEFDDIKDSADCEPRVSCIYEENGMKREVSVPLSPPMSPLMMQSSGPSSCMITKLESLVPDNSLSKAGRYMFKIHFDKEMKPPAKSCSWTYSEQLSKLFAQSEHDIRLQFRSTIDLPVTSELRSYLMYDDPAYANETVETCPVHIKDKAGTPLVGHCLRTCMAAESTSTRYERCPMSGRYVCISTLPMSPHNRLSFFMTFKLSCNTSCRGGINRRPYSAYFALYIKNVFEGQVKLHIHSSACPGRDRRNQEAKASAPASSSSSTTAPSTTMPTTPTSEISPTTTASTTSTTEAAETLVTIASSSSSKRPIDDIVPMDGPQKKVLRTCWDAKDDNWYTIKVFGKENAQILQKIAASMYNSQAYWRFAQNLDPEVTNPANLILTNEGFKNLSQRFSDPKIHSKGERKFEELKKKYDVHSTDLQRSQSDPTTSFTSKHRRMQLTLPCIVLNPNRK